MSTRLQELNRDIAQYWKDKAVIERQGYIVLGGDEIDIYQLKAIYNIDETFIERNTLDAKDPHS